MLLLFLLDDICFIPSSLNSSLTLESGNPILFSKNYISLSFCSISTSISSKLSPIKITAWSETLL